MIKQCEMIIVAEDDYENLCKDKKKIQDTIEQFLQEYFLKKKIDMHPNFYVEVSISPTIDILDRVC